MFHVDDVEPLGFAALRDVLKNGRQSHPAVMHGRHAEGDRASDKRVQLTFPIEFNERIPFYGLVPGGAVPPTYLQGKTLVLDRNVVTSLEQADSDTRDEAVAAGERWSFSFLDTPSNTVNPILGAFEGGTQSTPSLDEFREDVTATTRSIKRSLPSVMVTTFSEDLLQRMYAWRKSFDERAASEERFLQTVAPLLHRTVAARSLEQTASEVLRAADSCALKKGLVFLAVLAKLYESPGGSDWGTAQKLLKLRVPYSENDAYNALADLRQLELLASSQGLATPISLLTGDKALALFWCGLKIHSAQIGKDSARFNMNPDAELFPRMPTERRAELFS
ncbi:MAG: hypothetical protein V3W41_20280 [Planctomycetota bacterium]